MGKRLGKDAEAVLLQAVGADRTQSAARRALYRLVSFRVEFAQQADILHHNRQHARQRPHADGADEYQPPYRHIDAAQQIEQAAHRPGDRPRRAGVHHVARGEKRQRQRDNRRGQGAGENDRQRDADLREVVAERPVNKIVPDKHAQKIAAELLRAHRGATPFDAIEFKKEQVVKQDSDRRQRESAQIALLRREQRRVFLPDFADVRRQRYHAEPSTTRRRSRPEQVSSSDTTTIISSSVMLT